jgi:hypothetical protein
MRTFGKWSLIVPMLLVGCGKGNSDFDTDRERVNQVLRNSTSVPQLRIEVSRDSAELKDPNTSEEFINVVP